jgi:REP element-mobilizing transposase RayT
MPYDPAIHHHRSIRLRGYDYCLPGAYFVTLVTQGRECVFGEIQGDKITLAPAGKIVAACWQRLPAFFDIHLDEWVVMPNHFHGISATRVNGNIFANISRRTRASGRRTANMSQRDDIQIVRTRRKTIALIVQRDGTLLVRAPLRTSERQILDGRNRADWSPAGLAHHGR